MTDSITRKVVANEADLNRDPITGTPGAHPLGTGAGAASGAVAGAAAGMAVGGPLGGMIGAAVGAVAGGLARAGEVGTAGCAAAPALSAAQNSNVTATRMRK